MTIIKTLAIGSIAAAVLVGSIDMASAHYAQRGARHYAHRHGGGDAGAGLVAGAALGLLGAGIAGATAANNGYFYDYPAYGTGNPGFGYYGPGYGYYGY